MELQEQSLLTLVLNSGVASERREACEFLDLKTRVAQEKYRQLSADLERRRIRKYNFHLEEQRKVEQELDGLHKDRLRFEREKQLRKRKSFSSRGRKQSIKSSSKEEKITRLPMNEDALGGSASIAFDPKVEKYSRRRRRKAKTETFVTNSRKAEKDITNDAISFPYLSEGEVKKFHQSCKSAARSGECRRWGAAWLCAKKEQETAMNKNERWTSLLLNAEKEKMRVLCERLIASKEVQPTRVLECWLTGPGHSQLNSNSEKSPTTSDVTETSKKEKEDNLKNVVEDKENVLNRRDLEEKGHNNKREKSPPTTKTHSATKTQSQDGGQCHSSSIKVKESELPFVSPFFKGIALTKQLACFPKSTKKEIPKEQTLLQDVTSEDVRDLKLKTDVGTVSFLPEL